MKEIAKNVCICADILVGEMVVKQINKEIYTLQNHRKCKEKKSKKENTKH